jgi:hypothetical protein
VSQGEGKDLCDSTTGAINNTLASARKRLGASMMTAKQLARELARSTKMMGVTVAYEEGRDLNVVKAIHARTRGTRLTAKHDHAELISYLSRQYDIKKCDDGMVLYETLGCCAGQHVPEAVMVRLRTGYAIPSTGIDLRLVVAGSVEDATAAAAEASAAPAPPTTGVATAAATAANRSAAGAAVLTAQASGAAKVERWVRVRARHPAAEVASAACRPPPPPLLPSLLLLLPPPPLLVLLVLVLLRLSLVAATVSDTLLLLLLPPLLLLLPPPARPSRRRGKTWLLPPQQTRRARARASSCASPRPIGASVARYSRPRPGSTRTLSSAHTHSRVAPLP